MACGLQPADDVTSRRADQILNCEQLVPRNQLITEACQQEHGTSDRAQTYFSTQGYEFASCKAVFPEEPLRGLKIVRAG